MRNFWIRTLERSKSQGITPNLILSKGGVTLRFSAGESMSENSGKRRNSGFLP